MATPLHRAPSLADWRTAASRLGLQRRGGELVGPCPACGGEDRFRVTVRGGFFCRQCCPDRNAGADAMRRILEAAGLAREDDGGSLSAGPARREAGTRGRQTARSGGVSTYPEGPERRSTALPGLANNPIPGHGRNTGSDTPETADPGPERPKPPREAPSDLPARIWAASLAGSRDTAPVRAYLAGRGAWSPDAALPPSVRWLDREAAARLDRDAGRLALRLPSNAAGCIVYCFARRDAGLVAVQIEPLQADGARAPWPARKPGAAPVPRQTRGALRGAAFPIKPSGADSGPIHVAEGPVDALAIACWRDAQAWGAGGAGMLPALAPALAATGRAVVIEADGDGPGRKAAAALQDALHRADAQARLFYWPGCDPAEGLAAEWQERAACREADGMDRREAEAAAWRDMLC